MQALSQINAYAWNYYMLVTSKIKALFWYFYCLYVVVCALALLIPFEINDLCLYWKLLVTSNFFAFCMHEYRILFYTNRT